MTFCYLTMDNKTVTCFNNAARMTTEDLGCQCKQSCHDTNYKVGERERERERESEGERGGG
jgi:hypothetical protein